MLFSPGVRKFAGWKPGRDFKWKSGAGIPGGARCSEERDLPALRVFVELPRLSGSGGARRSGVVAGIHLGLSQAAGFRQMAEENDDGPQFFIGENAFGSGHTGRRNAVLQNPH